MSLEFLISKINNGVANKKSFGEIGQPWRIPRNTVNLGVIPGFKETEVLVSLYYIFTIFQKLTPKPINSSRVLSKKECSTVSKALKKI